MMEKSKWAAGEEKEHAAKRERSALGDKIINMIFDEYHCALNFFPELVKISHSLLIAYRITPEQYEEALECMRKDYARLYTHFHHKEDTNVQA